MQEAVSHAIQKTTCMLLGQQHADGYWCAELEGDTILESEYILLLAWLGRSQSRDVVRCAAYIASRQNADGGWSLYPGGKPDLSVSVKAYLALKIAGYDADGPELTSARDAIRAAGGADRVNSFTRFYLALLGQIPYSLCPAVPPEMMLLPRWFPINIYRISAWSRTIFVPLSIVWAHRPVRTLPVAQGIRELFVRQPHDWPRLESPAADRRLRSNLWARFFFSVDRLLKLCEEWRIRPLRRRAIRAAESWIRERSVDSDGLGAIFPPIVWCAIAWKCLGYTDSQPEVQSCLRELDKLRLDDSETTRLQPCLSPVWDTAITLRAFAATRDRTCRKAIESAVEWLLEKEVRVDGDWKNNVPVKPGGWFFEHRNPFYPDVDDTIMVVMALTECRQACMLDEPLASRVEAACDRGVAWLRAMQNRDGGWAAFDKDNDAQFLCHVPFADHNAMIDPSTPDITARVLEMLAILKTPANDPAIARAIRYLRNTQEADGSWFGRWGVNHIYGTWQVLVGLVAIGVPVEDPAVQRGRQWLCDQQQPNGGWGESADSYWDETRRGTGNTTASQTAWALLGLLVTRPCDHPAVLAGIHYLIDSQCLDGSWDEREFTGTGFPRVFYLRYHGYRIYFPLLALATYYRQAFEPGGVPPHKPQPFAIGKADVLG